jgi:hypothetical protein
MQNLNKQYIGNDFSKKNSSLDKLTADQVDAASELHMPLCMKVCISHVASEVFT